MRPFLYFLPRKKRHLYTWLFMADLDGVMVGILPFLSFISAVAHGTNPSLVFRRYVKTLQKTKKVVTTANFYLRNVSQFLNYFVQTKAKLCRLSSTQIVGVQRCMTQALRHLRKRVTLQQVEVKRVKMSRVLTVTNLQRCNREAKAAIPRLLGEPLSRSASPSSLRLPATLFSLSVSLRR